MDCGPLGSSRALFLAACMEVIKPCRPMTVEGSTRGRQRRSSCQKRQIKRESKTYIQKKKVDESKNWQTEQKNRNPETKHRE